jgi:ADP-ribose pyrophosphatase
MKKRSQINIWPRHNSHQVFSCPIFKVRCDSHAAPESGKSHDFFIIEPADWINIIAITPKQEIVLIEQYRYGSGAVTLEIPGGVIDAGEAALAAAKRELQEETGYYSEHWHLIGINEPNPAIQQNRCYTFLAADARPAARQNLDDTEVIEIRLEALADVPALIRSQQITHALVIAAFYFYDHWRA